MLLVIEDILHPINRILPFIWIICLIFFFFKSAINESQLDRMKRNMIGIKILSHLVLGYILVLLYLIINLVKPFQLGYASFSILDIIDFMILLFYSGTPLIFFQKQVAYSWPLNRMNNKTTRVLIIAVLVIIFIYILCLLHFNAGVF